MDIEKSINNLAFKRIKSLFAFIVLVCCLNNSGAFAQKYKTYENSRLSFSVIYPADIIQYGYPANTEEALKTINFDISIIREYEQTGEFDSYKAFRFLFPDNFYNKGNGFSVRCFRD